LNHLAVVTDGKTVQVWLQRKGERTTVAQTEAAPGADVRLRVACVNGDRFRFEVQARGGAWSELAGETDGSFLPPWDRGVRAGVYVAGGANAAGSFDYFVSTPGSSGLFTP
jgi:hypothetical protein